MSRRDRTAIARAGNRGAHETNAHTRQLDNRPNWRERRRLKRLPPPPVDADQWQLHNGLVTLARDTARPRTRADRNIARQKILAEANRVRWAKALNMRQIQLAACIVRRRRLFASDAERHLWLTLAGYNPTER